MAILVGMATIGLHYFFIKRVRLYFNMLEELKKNTTHSLNSHQRETTEQNSAFDAAVPVFQFKESLFLWPRELKIICILSLIIVLLSASLATANMAGWKSDTSVFFLLLVNCVVSCFLFFAPFIALLCIKLTGKLKKTIQQLEEATAQQEKTICMQDVRGGKNDE